MQANEEIQPHTKNAVSHKKGISSPEPTTNVTIEQWKSDRVKKTSDRAHFIGLGEMESVKQKNKGAVGRVQHEGLVLKSPVAYTKDTDRSILPIRPDGMATCKRCGAMGVKHAFYTKERDFCSVACAQEYTALCRKGEPIPVPFPVLDTASAKVRSLETKRWGRNNKLRHETSLKLEEQTAKFQVTKKIRRKNNVPSDSYDWRPALRSRNFNAAPVTCFPHAPGANCWEDITGRKVEVENTDCDDSSVFPNTFWVATALRVCGYYCLLRYEGFEDNPSKDFWVNYGMPDVHSVGWCAIRGNPLIPPRTIEHEQADWKSYLHKKLTGAETISLNFFSKITKSRECRFKEGMNVELVDKTHIARVKMATIKSIMGKRLILTYYDSEEEQHGFHCHEDSPLLHPVGWAREVGAQIDAPRDYLLRCETEDYDENDATKEYFSDRKLTIPDLPPDCSFKVGMKLEAIDPLNLSTICVATVMEVLGCGYVMIRINSYDDDPTNSDWFCYHSSSTSIFPAGFCDVNDIPLTPPKGYKQGQFSWTEYLQETGYETAPIALFNREVPDHGFKVGMKLEAADLMDPRLVCGASISRVVTRLLKVHFDGWDEEYDQWLDCESPDIYPVGWCELVGHKLEKPGPPQATYQVAKVVPKPQKKMRRRIKRGKGSPENPIGNTHTSTSSRNKPERILRKLPPKQTVSDDKGLQKSTRQLTTDEESLNSRLRRQRKSVQKVSPVQTPKTRRQMSDKCPDLNVPENNKSSANDSVPETDMKSKPKTEIYEENMDTAENNEDSTVPVPVASEPKKPPGKPNEPTGTLHVNSMGAADKQIPSLETNGSSSEHSEPGPHTPEQWNVSDVAEFLVINDCKTYSNKFVEKNIDGKRFLRLTKDEVMELADMKVGPSLKIYALIEQLKMKGNSSRQKGFNVRVSPKI